jgi:hypothetical protein
MTDEESLAFYEAVTFIGKLGEELAKAGMPAGDRTVIMANVRRLLDIRAVVLEAITSALMDDREIEP